MGSHVKRKKWTQSVFSLYPHPRYSCCREREVVMQPSPEGSLAVSEKERGEGKPKPMTVKRKRKNKNRE